MRSSRLFRFGMGVVLTVGLAACLDGTGGDNARSDGGAGRTAQTAERDIEAPNVFSKRDAGLWDGRPSLGGVWVAHPDVRDPERVIIRNTENGQETIGALFRRERMNPGPVFQVSADAAAAVAMLAGAPTRIEVIALRSEEIAVTAGSTDAMQAADAAPGPPPPAPASTPEPMATAAVAPDIADTGTPIALPPEDVAQPRRGLFSRIFRRDAQPDTVTDGVDTTALADSAPMPAPVSAAPVMPAPQAPPAQSALDRPYIQLGIFSVEANARRAQEMASAAGLSARVHAGSTQGNAFWRVTAGPAATSQERQQLLEQVKGLGFNDAYAVRR
ncbi:SPOR domain-containing protein [Roseinatronobacter alkalisoli]|uniref:SPOR domain-containing protein n=1 Tax=Roseinatronobacter alkalisoli TaxID=3028235 RepID=A0ABT5T7L8_9RHOB|nr:SPOR domain-containing protein [Roseinatronobacter sp. HJB301]MDD7970685.1 SPOR domain-containing protein [Roseinatronobacter sp. HJB301]